MMSLCFRYLAILLTLGGVVCLLGGSWILPGEGSVGDLWFALSADTLNLTQAVLERYVSVALWDPILLWILMRPVGLVLLGVAGVFWIGVWGVRRAG